MHLSAQLFNTTKKIGYREIYKKEMGISILLKNNTRFKIHRHHPSRIIFHNYIELLDDLSLRNLTQVIDGVTVTIFLSTTELHIIAILKIDEHFSKVLF